MDISSKKLYEDYVPARINGNVSLWPPMKIKNDKTFISEEKKSTVIIQDYKYEETKDINKLMALSKYS